MCQSRPVRHWSRVVTPVFERAPVRPIESEITRDSRRPTTQSAREIPKPGITRRVPRSPPAPGAKDRSTEASYATGATPDAVRSTRSQQLLRRRSPSARTARPVMPAGDILHGKEGVDGSSPSEGLHKMPANRHYSVVCSVKTRTHSGHICGTPDAARRLATPSDTAP